MATRPIRPTPALSISPATRADIPHLVEILSQSYLPEPLAQLYLLDWPSMTHIRPVFQHRMENRLGEMERGEETSVFKATLDETGEIVGTVTIHLVLAAGKPQMTEQNAGGGTELTEGVNMEFVRAVLPQMMRTDGIMKGTKHLEVVSLGVLPSYQRRGIGSLLLDECNKIADKHQLPTFLSAFPGVYELYIKHGYDEIDHTDIDLGQFGKPNRGYGNYRTYAMLRQPVAEKAVAPNGNSHA